MRSGWKLGGSAAIGAAIGLAIVGGRPTEAQLGPRPLPYDGMHFVWRSPAEYARRLSFQRPIASDSAAIWEILDRPIAMPFENDTPLGDVLRYIREQTAGEVFPDGLPIYVDPIELENAEETLESPVQIRIVGLPLRTTLGLALEQLGLRYDVSDEGYLHITFEQFARPVTSSDALIMDELWALHQDIERLKATRSGGGGGM